MGSGPAASRAGGDGLLAIACLFLFAEPTGQHEGRSGNRVSRMTQQTPPSTHCSFRPPHYAVQLYLDPLFVNPQSIGHWRGKPKATRVLSENRCVNPGRSDNFGQTPLSLATKNGHDGVVKLLLGREDVSPDNPDNDGRTPLSWAAWNGCDGVMELLLEQEDVSLNREDNYGQSPLILAAMNGYGGIVELLRAPMSAAGA